MNKRQKLVQEQFLNREESVIKRLKQVYNQSLKDIEGKAAQLQTQINALQDALDSVQDPEEREKLKSMHQSKVYQKQYQDALKKQVGSILDNMQVEEFKTVSDYLNKCYEDGFIGTMYDLHGQGIPLCFPIDQEAVVRAVQLDSKISQGLYNRLGEDVTVLKKKILAQVSRGISTGMTYKQIAQQLSNYTNIGYNNAVRIARTEGHRIHTQSAMDACYKAKDKGADVVKQWDATLDGATRPSHQQVDGQIRELDEAFSNGLMYPGDPAGGAAEVCNCRCALLQRSRKALDEEELETLKERAEFFGLDKTEDFEDFKKKYLKAAESFQDAEKENIDYSARRKERMAQRNQAQQSGESNVESLDALRDRVATKHNINIDTGEIGKLTDEAKRQIEAIDNLLDEYNSTMVDFRFVKGSWTDGEGGSCYMLKGKSSVAVKTTAIKKNAPDNLNLGENKDLMVTYHEFAHAFSQSREDMDDEFWKELKKVRTQYRKGLKEIDKAELVDHSISFADAKAAREKIFISDYANSDIDEFLAEAFAQAKLSTDPSPYAKDVLKTVDKYFKKPLTNVGKSDKITAEPLSRYLNSSEALYKNAKKVKAIDGYEDIFIHGDKTGFSIKDLNGVEHDTYTVREFANILKSDPTYHGGAIRLFSCETGADGATAAQSLANLMNQDVLAPTDIVWVDFEGKVTIGPDQYTNSGDWKLFKPMKKGGKE